MTAEAKTPELKPLLDCPFCGGEAEISQIGNEATAKRGFEVKCVTWGCATKKRAMVIRQPLEKARAYAIAAWNTRAQPQSPALDGLVAAIEAVPPYARLDLTADKRAAFMALTKAEWQQVKAALSEVRALRGANGQLFSLLKELHALVLGECPSLLNEDSGGSARLGMEIEAQLSALRSLVEDKYSETSRCSGDDAETPRAAEGRQ